MTLDDLNVDIKKQLLDERTKLCSKWKENSAYRVCFTDLEGTRYFTAARVCVPGKFGKAFGGGTYWKLTYGKILWRKGTNPVGGKEYYWVRSNQTFVKSINGTIIPKSVDTKKEVLEIAKKIGTLVI